MAGLTKGQVMARMNSSSDARVTAIRSAIPMPSTKKGFVDLISTMWEDVRQKFLEIGRSLNHAKRVLDHGEFTAMVERELPFTAATAFQMRAVADAVDCKRLQVSELPNSYSIAYQLTTLSDEELEHAREKSIIRPSLKRAEILSFKNEIRSNPAGDAKTRKTLEREREKLVRRIQEIDEQLNRMNGRTSNSGTDIDLDKESYSTLTQS